MTKLPDSYKEDVESLGKMSTLNLVCSVGLVFLPVMTALLCLMLASCDRPEPENIDVNRHNNNGDNQDGLPNGYSLNSD